jgi:hypothetical protein
MDAFLVAAGLTTLALGGAMILFAWRVVLQNRRQEAARVELLSALAFPDAARIDSGGSDPSFHLDEFEGDEFRREPPLQPSSLFVEPETSGSSSRRTIALAAVCLVMTLLVGGYAWFAGTRAPVSSPSASASSTSVAPRPAATTRPATAHAEPRVELLALDHSVTADSFLVTGRVRNPIEGAPLHDVVAVVTIADSAGRTLTTVRAPVTPAVIGAGESSDFSIAAGANAANVGRYRVTFDARERDTIPQVDRRRTESIPRPE